MAQVMAVESPSLGEELLVTRRDVCNFSTITDHTHDQESIDIVWWSNVVCLPVIALVGLACNLLNIAILTSNRGARRIPSWYHTIFHMLGNAFMQIGKRYRCESKNRLLKTLLLALAVCDCLFLLFATLEVTPLSIPSLAFSPLFNHTYSHFVLYIRTLASTFYKSSVLIVVAFNVERYICVVFPLKSHRLCTGRTSRLAIYACLCLSFLCSVQWPLCYEVKLCYENQSDEYYYVVLLTENETLKYYYRFMDYFSLVGFNLLPIGSLLVMNMRIIMTLRRVVDEDSRRDEEITRLADGTLVQEPASHRLNANAMLFAVVFMLLICVGPQALARLLFDLYGQYHSTAIVYTCVTQQLVFLNASLNFCLYCVVSKRYRSLMRVTVKRLLRALAVADRHPLKLSTKQSKSSSAHATSLDDHHHSRNILMMQPL